MDAWVFLLLCCGGAVVGGTSLVGWPEGSRAGRAGFLCLNASDRELQLMRGNTECGSSGHPKADVAKKLRVASK